MYEYYDAVDPLRGARFGKHMMASTLRSVLVLPKYWFSTTLPQFPTPIIPSPPHLFLHSISSPTAPVHQHIFDATAIPAFYPSHQ